MRPLNAVDYTFALLDKRQPMYVAALCVFDGDEVQARTAFAHLSAPHIAIAPFNQVRQGMHFVDVAIEPQAHIFLTKLGGDIDTLTQYLGKIHANPLPKDRPLWQCQIFILDNAFALYIKIHHTLIDGVGAMRMVMASFADGALPFWAQALTKKHIHTPSVYASSAPTTAPQSAPSYNPKHANIRAELANFRHRARDGKALILRTLLSKNLPPDTKRTWQTLMRHTATALDTKNAPITALAQPIHKRQLHAVTIQRMRIDTIARAQNVSPNTALIAVLGEAVARYLARYHQAIDKPLVAFVPVNLRHDNSTAGNQFLFMPIQATSQSDNLLSSVRHVHMQIQDEKALLGAMNFSAACAYNVVRFGMAGVRLATGLGVRHQAFNLIISSVNRGKKAYNLHGAPLRAIYPFSVLLHGQALNLTYTMGDDINLGVCACPVALPHIGTLGNIIDEVLDDYQNTVDNLVSLN